MVEFKDGNKANLDALMSEKKKMCVDLQFKKKIRRASFFPPHSFLYSFLMIN